MDLLLKLEIPEPLPEGDYDCEGFLREGLVFGKMKIGTWSVLVQEVCD